MLDMPLLKHVQLITVIFNEYVAKMAIHALADLGKSGYEPDLKVQIFNHSCIFSATY
jgi:hypothetical protein